MIAEADTLLPALKPTMAVGTTTASLVTDVRLYLEHRQGAVNRWKEEEPLFNRLPLLERSWVRRSEKAFIWVREMSTRREDRLSVQAACRKALALYVDLGPLKTFRARFDNWLKTGDWLSLVNRAKAGADWQQGERGLPVAFLSYVEQRMTRFRRGDAGEQAIISIKRQWITGRNHDGHAEPIHGYEKGWADRNPHIEPVGWHSSNIRRQLKKHAKFTKALKAAAHMGSAEAKKHLPQVNGTRAGLRFMELVQFDDVRCDFRVIDTTSGQVCDLWLLIARDVATGMLLKFGMRPALARDDGSQEHLKLADMKQLCGSVLETFGLPPWIMEWVLENGTATLDRALRTAIQEYMPGKIDFQMASMVGGKSSAGYWEKKVGNSRAKAMLESLNRLMHMMASHLPGQIGASYALRPADLIEREAEARKIWASHRAEDREQLHYPILTIPQAREHLFEIFHQQNTRAHHQHEGFDQIVEAFNGSAWVPATTEHNGQPTRVRMETPMERAAKLVHPVNEWSRVSPEVMVAFYEHSNRIRPVEDNGQIEFMHEGKKLRFEAPTDQFKLKPETKVNCYFNEHDPRFLTITDQRGGILGTWLRCGLVKHGDREALAAAIKHSTHELNIVTARAHELGAGERQQLEAMREHNAGFVTVAAPANQNALPATRRPSLVTRLNAVAGEKAVAKQKQRQRDDDHQIAREALRNLA